LGRSLSAFVSAAAMIASVLGRSGSSRGGLSEAREIGAELSLASRRRDDLARREGRTRDDPTRAGRQSIEIPQARSGRLLRSERPQVLEDARGNVHFVEVASVGVERAGCDRQLPSNASRLGGAAGGRQPR
jgi:hypothetical protein